MLFKLGCSQPADLYVKVGGKFITPQTISVELNIAGITKDKFHISTIRVRGADKPGLLYDITGLIKKTGRNIEMVNMQKRGEGMDLRLLVKNLSPEEEESLRLALQSDDRFSECLVV